MQLIKGDQSFFSRAKADGPLIAFFLSGEISRIPMRHGSRRGLPVFQSLGSLTDLSAQDTSVLLTDLLKGSN